jgi:F420-dependent oxidoreductase-like protein
MHLGIHYANFTLPGGAAAIAPTLSETAQIADEGGVRMFTVMDHFFQMPQFRYDWHDPSRIADAEDPMLEGYTTLGFVAARTKTMYLGTLVTGVTYRHPGLLAKAVSTLDMLSGGRGILGIGAAWYEREHLGLGVRFPPVSERFERLAETVQIVRQMWSDNDGPFNGKHYQLAETICQPKLLVKRPTIMIGGSGERKTLRLVAEYGDGCNLFGSSVADITHKLDVLRRHCDDVGRDFATIQKTMMVDRDPLDDTDAFLRDMEAYAAAGIGLITLVPKTQDPAGFTERLVNEVLPRLLAIS